MKKKKYQHIEREMVWNNVQFIPERKNVWYRGMSKGKVSHSAIIINNRRISIAFFTYGDLFADEPLKEGWRVNIYEDHKSIAHRGLHTKDHIIAKDITDAEIQALKWAETIMDEKIEVNCCPKCLIGIKDKPECPVCGSTLVKRMIPISDLQHSPPMG